MLWIYWVIKMLDRLLMLAVIGFWLYLVGHFFAYLDGRTAHVFLRPLILALSKASQAG